MNFGAEIVDLESVRFTPELLRCIPAAAALKYRVLPVADYPQRLVVAFALNEALDLNALDYLCQALKREIEVRIADEQQLEVFLQRFYGDGAAAG